MNRRTFIRNALAAGVAPLIAGRPGGMPHASAGGGRRPNIIYIMSDDQGPWAWGGGGHPNARTPHLDRLRGQGALLANYFVTCPVCSPSRASTLSSRYPSEHGIFDVLPARDEPKVGLDPALPVWPALLNAAGYRTGMFGKWHVGYHDDFLPRHFGYEEFAGWRNGAEISKDPLVEVDGEERRMEGYTPDIITDFAVDFMRQPSDRPFLMSLHFFAPHANTENKTPDGDRTWLPLSEADWGPFRDLAPTLPEPRHPKLDVPRTERMTREYLASAAAVDRNVGRLLAALDALGEAGNTIVIFTSDHGYNMGHHGVWHKGSGRWLLVDNQGSRFNMWDTSLRSPAIVRWPGVIEPGSTVNHTTSNLDWLPTICAMAGVAVPAEAIVRGRNALPLLRGKDAAWDDDFFAQYRQWPRRGTGVDLRAYRTPSWKLVRDFTREGHDELYHLEKDPKELNNLIDSTGPEVAAIREDLGKKMLKMMRRVNDPAVESGAL